VRKFLRRIFSISVCDDVTEIMVRLVLMPVFAIICIGTLYLVADRIGYAVFAGAIACVYPIYKVARWIAEWLHDEGRPE
jgi:hypothetical protein